MIAYAGLGLLIAAWYAAFRDHKALANRLTIAGFALIALGVLAR